MKHIFYLFVILCFSNTFSQSPVSGFIVVPEEDVFELEYRNKAQKIDSSKLFTYTAMVEDPYGVLDYFGVTSQELSRVLRIPGQTYKKDLSEADVAYRYVFSSADVENEELYENGKVLSTGGYDRPYYQVRGAYNFNVCFEKILLKKGTKSGCSTVEELARIKIETEENLDPSGASASWRRDAQGMVWAELRKRLKRDFSFQTGGEGIITKYKVFLYTALFNLKGNKKHLKKESDRHAKNLKAVLKLYTADFNDYFAYDCALANPPKYLPECYKTYRDKMQALKDQVPEAIAFWKNELQSKYSTKGKKKEIRNAMALNLYTAAIIEQNTEVMRYAYTILAEERYGNKTGQHKGGHYDMKYIVEKLEAKPYELIPTYYDYGKRFSSAAESPEDNGANYPLH